MFGWVKEIPQTEDTPFNPANPYAAAKQYAHAICKIYRASYNTFISNGILFNHRIPAPGLGVCHAEDHLFRGVRQAGHSRQ